MTREEAIEILRSKMDGNTDTSYEFTEAIRMAIKALEQDSSVLADMLMEERIRGGLDTDTIFEKNVIRDVKCKLTVSIQDRRPCYCGAELREVWRENEEENNEHD